MDYLALAFFVSLFALFGSFAPASAYIDPATTSYILEALVGLVVVGGAAVGYYWRKFRNKVNKTEESQGVSVEEQLSGLDDED